MGEVCGVCGGGRGGGGGVCVCVFGGYEGRLRRYVALLVCYMPRGLVMSNQQSYEVIYVVPGLCFVLDHARALEFVCNCR